MRGLLRVLRVGAYIVAAVLAFCVPPTAAHASGSVDLVAFAGGFATRNLTLYPRSYTPTQSLSLGAVTRDPVPSGMMVSVTIDVSHLAASFTVEPQMTQYCAKGTGLIVCSGPMTAYAGYTGEFFAGITFTIAAGTPPGPAGYLSFTVAGGSDSNLSNNTGRVDMDVLNSEQTKLSLTTTRPTVTVGQIATIPLVIRNLGPNTDPNLQFSNIALTWPQGAAQALPSTGCQLNGGAFSCTIDDLRAGQTVEFDLRFNVLKCGDSGSGPSHISGGGMTTLSTLTPSPDSNLGAVFQVFTPGCDSAGQAGQPAGQQPAAGTAAPGPSPRAGASGAAAADTAAASPSPTATIAAAPTVANYELSAGTRHGSTPGELAVGITVVGAAFVVAAFALRRRRHRAPTDETSTDTPEGNTP
jgi:hypothetical protein